MAKPFPGPYEARQDEYGGVQMVLWSTADPGPRGQGVFLGFVYPVKPVFVQPTPEQAAEATATAELFAKADVLLKCVEELLPLARGGAEILAAVTIGDDPDTAKNRAMIERAEAAVAALKGAK